MTLNPSNGITFRGIDANGSIDRSGFYGISITATAVPEPADFALVLAGATLGAALFFRLRRRRRLKTSGLDS